MNAQVLDLETRFQIEGPVAPRSVTITLRPCWRKPPIKIELVYAFEVNNVVYYHLQRRLQEEPQ